MPAILPPIPEQPVHNSFVLFGPTPAQLAWIVSTLHAEHQAILNTQEQTMSAIADLVSHVTSLDSKVDALIAALAAAKANPATHLTPEDQAALDGAVAALTNEESAVDTANPPAAPAPAPAA